MRNYSHNLKGIFNKSTKQETIVPNYFMRKQKSQFDSNRSRRGAANIGDPNSVGEFIFQVKNFKDSLINK